jgi:hypothetical protein
MLSNPPRLFCHFEMCHFDWFPLSPYRTVDDGIAAGVRQWPI